MLDLLEICGANAKPFSNVRDDLVITLFHFQGLSLLNIPVVAFCVAGPVCNNTVIIAAFGQKVHTVTCTALCGYVSRPEH